MNHCSHAVSIAEGCLGGSIDDAGGLAASTLTGRGLSFQVHAVPTDCSAHAPQFSTAGVLTHTMPLAESDWHDARDAFSYTDEGGAPRKLTQPAHTLLCPGPTIINHGGLLAVLSAEDLELSPHEGHDDPVRPSSRPQAGATAGQDHSTRSQHDPPTPSSMTVTTPHSSTSSNHSAWAESLYPAVFVGDLEAWLAPPTAVTHPQLEACMQGRSVCLQPCPHHHPCLQHSQVHMYAVGLPCTSARALMQPQL
jgi:hypothetical protein